MPTIKGPGIFLAQFLREEEPYNNNTHPTMSNPSITSHFQSAPNGWSAFAAGAIGIKVRSRE